MTSGLLSGCFESPTSPTSTSSPIPKETTPLKHTTREPFKLPDGVTEIRSAFSEADTKDWGNAQNWTSSFYKDGESVDYDLSHKFVPCRSQKLDLPTRISIDNGTCFVNENVELSGLEMTKNTRLTIPEGVSVKSITKFDMLNVTIDGGGDFYGMGKTANVSCTGNVTLNKFHAPEVTWCGMEALFEVNQAKLHS